MPFTPADQLAELSDRINSGAFTQRVYTVTHKRGCVLIIGEVPVDEFCALAGVWGTRDGSGGEGWIDDALLARALGVTFALGPRAACLAWRAELGVVEPAVAP
jgi:hypothetical protein